MILPSWGLTPQLYWCSISNQDNREEITAEIDQLVGMMMLRHAQAKKKWTLQPAAQQKFMQNPGQSVTRRQDTKTIRGNGDRKVVQMTCWMEENGKRWKHLMQARMTGCTYQWASQDQQQQHKTKHHHTAESTPPDWPSQVRQRTFPQCGKIHKTDRRRGRTDNTTSLHKERPSQNLGMMSETGQKKGGEVQNYNMRTC